MPKKLTVIFVLVSFTSAAMFSTFRGEALTGDLGIQAALAASATTLIDVRVATGADDVEQRLSNGRMTLDSSVLDMVNDASTAKGDQIIGIRFNNINIARGAVISNAYIEFQANTATSETTSLMIRGEAIDNAAAFNDSTRNLSKRAKTNASVSWSNLPAWSTVGANVQSPNLGSVIQEIINRSGWAPGNSLVLIIDGSGRRMANAYEADSANAPLLHIEYLVADASPTPTQPAATATPILPTAVIAPATPTPTNLPATPLPTTTSGGTAIDVRIGAGADDIEQRLSDGHMYLASSDLELVNDPGVALGDQSIGLRFTGVNIPQGSTITNAYIEFRVDEASSETTALVIRGQATDNAASFTTNANDLANRSKTAASVSWTNLPAWTTVGAVVQTPDVASVVQEIVNRGGWAAGNSLVLTVDGSGRRVAQAFEASPANAALLHVVYLPNVVKSTVTPTPPPADIQPQPVGQSGTWRIIFRDEFDSNALDKTKWHTCFWWADTTCSIETNNELELYNPEDVLVQNGLLRLRAQKRNMTAWNGATYNYTSGMVMTGGRKGKIAPGFTFTYGYAEARVKIPTGQGLWPAFWMLPVDYTTRPEIDIMEILGHEPNVDHFNYHYIGGDKGSTWTGPDFSTGWHVLGIDWRPDAIVWYVDGVEQWRYTDKATISNKASYLLLNLAVGGNWPGSPNASTVFPSVFEIDYVRAWQK